MKHLALYSSLLGVLCLAAPSTGLSKDHGHHHHGGGDRYCGSYRPYCGPNISYRSYGYPYYYGAYSGYPAYSYYTTPSIGVTFTTRPTYRTSSYGDDLAVDVQRALSRRGYYHGSIDGDVGPGTRAAIREYQYRNRLEVTGRIDRSLIHSLGLS